MRGVIAIAAAVAVTLAACAGSQPSVLDDQTTALDDPPSTGSVAQAQTVAGSREVAAQMVRVQHTLQASNDVCVVYWRSMDVRQHPERSSYLECNGLKAYPDPQPPGHPVSLAACDRQLRERQARMAVPVIGMTDEQKATYRATWEAGR
jgi:hypothetical protein